MQYKNFIRAESAYDAVQDVDIITTAINDRTKTQVIKYDWIKNQKNVFFNAIGGDSVGKTELDPEIIEKSRVIIEYYPQTKDEGEIQNVSQLKDYTEVWELVSNKREGRTEKDNFIVFDSVGFALSDFSIMKLFYEKGIGEKISLLPEINNPKNLFDVLRNNQ